MGKNNRLVLNEETEIEILDTIIGKPTSSLLTVAEQTGMSRDIVRTSLKMQILEEFTYIS